jgi:nitrate reductase alpha subunit
VLYKLPLGFSARLTWRDGRYEVEWFPYKPDRIRSARNRLQVIDAYRAARREFLQVVAAELGYTENPVKGAAQKPA